MTTTGKAEVRQRLTAAEAQAQGLVPAGHVWNERDQAPEPRGFALEAAALERPLDLARQLDTWKRNRDVLLSFVRDYLEEASYDEKGYPIPGQVRDYYKVPGSQTKALTKRGGEKVANLFRFGKAETRVVDKTETKEYVSATVEVTLADHYRRPIGSAVSSCATAEGGFASERAKKKYGGDYRAALNDVVARAAKRAFVQAVIVAAAADEVFTAAEDVDPNPDPPAPAPSPAPPSPRLPKSPALKQYAGKEIKELPSDALTKIALTLRTKATNPKVWQPVIEAIEWELECRTQTILGDQADDFDF